MPPAIIITGHGHFADGMKSALELISGPQKAVHAVNFAEGDTPETLGGKLEKIVKLYDNNGVVVFCDIIGGAPFRQAVLLTRNRANSEVVYGTTLQMLIEAVLERDGCGDAQQLVAQLLPAAREGIGSMSSHNRRTPPPDPTEEGL